MEMKLSRTQNLYQHCTPAGSVEAPLGYETSYYRGWMFEEHFHHTVNLTLAETFYQRVIHNNTFVVSLFRKEVYMQIPVLFLQPVSPIS